MSVTIPSYTEHQSFIGSIIDKDMSEIIFKNQTPYSLVLENVSREHGTEYLNNIEKQFPEVTYDDIRSYINANDKYGGSYKTIFTMSTMKLLYCSATTIRYIYHALLILKYYQETACKNIVELGQGYGGLFLAINMFSWKFPKASIKSYTMIDLPKSCKLTNKYLEIHSTLITIPWMVNDNESLSDTMVIDCTNVTPNETFFISNYCFTAINKSDQSTYVDKIISKCSHGFLVWQTCFGYGIDRVDDILKKSSVNKKEEDPQTASERIKNYYVWF
jgi:hypothetical protein